MSRAEDAVRARMAAEQADAAQAARARAERTETAIASHIAKIEDAIPRILRGLQARDYENARMIRVDFVSHGVFRKRLETVEIAAWLLYEYSDGDYHNADYLLSDGRLHGAGSGEQGSGTSTGAYTVRQMSQMWKPDQVLLRLEHIWHGGARGRRGLGGVSLPDGPGGLKWLLEYYGSLDA